MTTNAPTLVGVISVAYFLMITLASKIHFNSEKFPPGMYLVSILTIAGTAVLAHACRIGAIVNAELALVILISTSALFIWAIKASRKAFLPVAFDVNAGSEFVIKNGPWRYFRHPFYVSYILYWSATVIANPTIIAASIALTLTGIYIYLAAREEMALLGSDMGEEYAEYCRKVGFFWPRLGRVFS